MSSHCGHCRRKTPSINPVTKMNSAGRPMIHTTCAVCGQQQLPRAVSTGAARRSCVAKCRTRYPKKKGAGIIDVLRSLF